MCCARSHCFLKIMDTLSLEYMGTRQGARVTLKNCKEQYAQNKEAGAQK